MNLEFAKDERLVLRPAKRKLVRLLAASLAFTIVGVLMRREQPIGGWLVLLFFGFCSLLFSLRLLPQAAYLELRPEGFITCEYFRAAALIRWETVSEFAIARVPTAPTILVVFDEANPKRPKLAKVNKSLMGFTSGLPDTYGRSPAELADQLNFWRNRALSRTRTDSDI